jgi:hypothetical protein
MSKLSIHICDIALAEKITLYSLSCYDIEVNRTLIKAVEISTNQSCYLIPLYLAPLAEILKMFIYLLAKDRLWQQNICTN